MFVDPDGPIEKFEWGSYQINGQVHSADGEGVGKDILMIDGKVLSWDERKGHRIKPFMVERALQPRVRTLVIGNGAKGRLRLTRKTRQAVEDAGVALVIEKTPKACAVYNRLSREGKAVALLAHGTC